MNGIILLLVIIFAICWMFYTAINRKSKTSTMLIEEQEKIIDDLHQKLDAHDKEQQEDKNEQNRID